MSSANQRWVWLDPAVVRATHDEQLAEHGGPTGVRDPNLLVSALARPQQLANYGEPDVADLAAAYGFGIARNHPFVDGNKRTAFVALELFLWLNGHELTATDVECVVTVLDLAAGNLEEAVLANWIRSHLQARV
ncbi:type II toxin-antitoxin system death-on-curing family toxin [Variovorax sp. J22G21]|uniref:type II toxin-antitoxin system death-on-curing family toxin n=1 Tax=Variovorax fucosicus TaxID=3053517 RepID=UPI002574CDEB|nr:MULTISPECIES: type II toxin-antitoxin system death-on-curing family toxin [unclassified Variovorax]MDM0040017.1 type II toxin-antitoxin system death-on-curing family toxin [Variovorax sp. J22R193]MDM0061390.1 type II toxin-antitoxin system death-on-curing family toxin [Variovorax sp. J22G21]